MTNPLLHWTGVDLRATSVTKNCSKAWRYWQANFWQSVDFSHNSLLRTQSKKTDHTPWNIQVEGGIMAAICTSVSRTRIRRRKKFWKAKEFKNLYKSCFTSKRKSFHGGMNTWMNISGRFPNFSALVSGLGTVNRFLFNISPHFKRQKCLPPNSQRGHL